VPDTVLEGPEQPPADLDPGETVSGTDTATTSVTLAQRDPQVALALNALNSSHVGAVARRSGASVPAAQ